MFPSPAMPPSDQGDHPQPVTDWRAQEPELHTGRAKGSGARAVLPYEPQNFGRRAGSKQRSSVKQEHTVLV